MMTETGEDLSDFEADSHERITGFPTLGCTVEIQYKSNAGGAFRTNEPVTVRGELVDIDVSEWSEHTAYDFRVHDRERGRFVGFSGTGGTVNSFADWKQDRGRRIGMLKSVHFEDDQPCDLAPAYQLIKQSSEGDTVSVNGTRYAVFDRFKDKKLRLARGEDRYTFSVSDGGDIFFQSADGGEIDVKSLNHVSERGGDEYSPEPADPDLFPKPHGMAEGERVTLSISPQADIQKYDSGLSEEQREWTGVVETVDFDIREYSESDPDTVIRLDEGGKITISNRVGPNKIKAFVVPDAYTWDDDGEPEPFHVDGEDFSISTDGEDFSISTDGEDSEPAQDGADGDDSAATVEPGDSEDVSAFLAERPSSEYLIRYSEGGEQREIRGQIEDVHSVLMSVTSPDVDGGQVGLPIAMVDEIRTPPD